MGSASAADGINLVLWDGTMKTVTPALSKHPKDSDGGGRVLAGKVMLRHGCGHGISVCCRFYLLRSCDPVALQERPACAWSDVLPIDFFPCRNDDRVITSSSITSLWRSSLSAARLVYMSSGSDSGNGPFECIRDSDGKVLIKVLPDFITRLILQRNNICNNENSVGSSNTTLCDTPELKKQYDLLVGSKEQAWSRKLDIIKEFRSRSCSSRRFSPGCSFFRSRSLNLTTDR